jgi:3-methyladenine DNA glycosylase Tag
MRLNAFTYVQIKAVSDNITLVNSVEKKKMRFANYIISKPPHKNVLTELNSIQKIIPFD